MNLSVVICASDDPRLFRCIESVDAKVEIVCAVTPNVEIERRLRKRGIAFSVVEKGSHSAVSNAGINLVHNDSFVLMDSDCVFVPGALTRFHEALQIHPVAKGPIHFLHDSASWLSCWISRCRAFDNTYLAPLYKPALGLRTEVASAIGGWFDSRLRSTVDADVAHRITRSNLSVCYIEGACVVHDPISFSHNLHSCYSYGRGDAARRRLLRQYPADPLLLYEMKRHVEFLHIEGASGLPFLLLNDIVYYTGFVAELLSPSV